jgi:hypothetical protein
VWQRGAHSGRDSRRGGAPDAIDIRMCTRPSGVARWLGSRRIGIGGSDKARENAPVVMIELCD